MITNKVNFITRIFISCASTLLMFILMAAFFSTAPAYADEGGLSVDGAIINRSAAPGETFIHAMTVSLGDGSPALDITITALGLGQKLDGTFLELAPEDDNPELSSREFITSIEPVSFHLDPGDSQTVSAVVNVPADLGDGSHYSVIYVRGISTNDSGVAFIPAIDVPVIISGANLEKSGAITNVTAGDIVFGSPITINTTVSSQGNHHFKATNAVTLADNKGRVIATSAEHTTQCSIIPGYSFAFTGNLEIAEELSPGKYTLESVVVMDDGTKLSETIQLNLAHGYQHQYGTVAGETGQPRSLDKTTDRGISWWFVAISLVLILLIGIIILLARRKRRQSER